MILTSDVGTRIAVQPQKGTLAMNKIIKWLVAIYVVAILAWSGLLKAEEIVLDRVHFDSQYFELTIGGKVTNTCDLSLKTKIIEN